MFTLYSSRTNLPTLPRIALLIAGGLLPLFAPSAWAETPIDLPASNAAAPGFLGPQGRFATIPHDAALQKTFLKLGLDGLAIQHGGVEETLASYSRIVLADLTGGESIRGQDPVFSVLSMVYEPERWLTAEIFPVDSPWLGEFLGLPPAKKWMAVTDYYHSPNREALNRRVKEDQDLRSRIATLRETRNTAIQARTVGLSESRMDSWTPEGMTTAEFAKLVDDPITFSEYSETLKSLEAKAAEAKPEAEAAARFLGRIQGLVNLSAGFLIAPDPANYKGEWATPWSRETGDTAIAAIARDLDSALNTAFAARSTDGLPAALNRFHAAVESLDTYPTPTQRRARTFYVEVQPFRKTAWIYLLSVLVWGVWGITRSRVARGVAIGVLAAGYAMHTATEVLRLYLSGHMPVSNMYESITFATWAMMTVGLGLSLVARRTAFAVAAGVVGFLALMLVGFMPLHETRIHALRAVLNSYWLNIHVTMMLMSYGAFLLAGVLSIGYLAGRLLAKTSAAAGYEAFELYAYRCVQVGWPLLTVGVFLGGVWAETAWGRFWGWDPKETWALITWIVYTVYLHTRMVLGWRGRISAIACVVGFLAVLVTWLGVSYLPGLAGGLHSYASPTG